MKLGGCAPRMLQAFSISPGVCVCVCVCFSRADAVSLHRCASGGWELQAQTLPSINQLNRRFPPFDLDSFLNLCMAGG